MNNVIRFPYYADPDDGKLPMATKRSWWRRFLLWLGFEPPKKRANVARRKVRYARYGR